MGVERVVANRQELARAIRLLGRLWLSELSPDDVAPIRGLPVLGPALDEAIAARGGDESVALIDLAAEHHRLFGIEMPPYESVFVDPSGMLGAPASERVAARLERAGWRAPAGVRVAAPDHVGLELLALADFVESGADAAADGLVRDHLALWVPPMVLALPGLGAVGVYGALGELTMGVVLGRLREIERVGRGVIDGIGGAGEDGGDSGEDGIDRNGGFGRDGGWDDPFPNLPPAPRYRGSEESDAGGDSDRETRGETEIGEERDAVGEGSGGDRRIARRLMIAREAGMYLSRGDIRRAARAAGVPVPGGAGDRVGLLVEVLRTARTLDVEADVAGFVQQVFREMGARYEAIAEREPAWARYAAAWGRRVDASVVMLDGVG